jgi:hypothetical protein
MRACTATLRRHQLVSVSPTFASEKNFKSLPILLQHQTTHTHTQQQQQQEDKSKKLMTKQTNHTQKLYTQIPAKNKFLLQLGRRKKKKNKQKFKKQENQASNPLQILFNKDTQTKAPLPFVSLKTPHIHTTVEHV